MAKEKKIYHCSDKQHNKMWSYEINGLEVIVEYGRVGGHITSDKKIFDNQHAVNDFIINKVKEKINKKYKEVTKTQLQEEIKTAQALGTQYKIGRIEWTSLLNENTLRINENYNDQHWVYVEILNSWDKTKEHYLINKTGQRVIYGDLKESGKKITFGSSSDIGNTSQIEAIRDYLKRLCGKVVEAVKSIGFGAIGVRKLDLGGGDDKTEAVLPAVQIDEVFKSINEAGASSQVVAKFAALGARQLDL